MCAGADVAGTVACALAADGARFSCVPTMGWLTTAFSPLGLPGRGTHVFFAEVSWCSSVGGCHELPASNGQFLSCSFSAIQECGADEAIVTNTILFGSLAMGECVTMHVDMTAQVEATVTSVVAIERHFFENTGRVSGQVCRTDDGR